MPTSAPDLIAWGCQILERLQPRRVLDVGIGYGKWGFLVREYAEPRNPATTSSIFLQGLEPFSEYITNVQKSLYDQIDYVTVEKANLTTYDLIIMGDVIEHLELDRGHLLLQKLLACTKAILIMTPREFDAQGAVHGNEHERHLSLWKPEEFRSYKVLDQSIGSCVHGVLLKGTLE